jgi:hypothetical protein
LSESFGLVRLPVSTLLFLVLGSIRAISRHRFVLRRDRQRRWLHLHRAGNVAEDVTAAGRARHDVAAALPATFPRW